MKSKNLLYLVAMAVLLLGAQPASAASAAMREMAGIMLHLEHYPTDMEKARLKAVADNATSTDHESVLARAISRLKHKVADEDKGKLKRVMDDASAPAEVRDLAGMVLNLNHMPNAADKSRLEQMLK